jgi:hypothetical protein
MKILMLLTNAFDPDPRVYKEAKSLVQAGHEIEIFCWDRESRYRENPVEILDGIRIIRFFSKGSYGAGFWQLAGYLAYFRAAKKHAAICGMEAVHCHDFDALVIGNSISKKHKVRLVFDEHDFFHLYFKNRRGWLNRYIARLIILCQKRIMKKVHAHIVVTPKMKEFYGTNEKVVVITNAPLKESFTQTRKKEKQDKPVIGFVGTVRYFEELKTLMEEAKNFPDIHILIAGKGRALGRLLEFYHENPMKNVTITGEYTLKDLESIYAGIDVTYLIYPPEDSEISLPNKFFESIITQTPIIADLKAEYGRCVHTLRIGWTIDRERLRESIRGILTELDTDASILDEFRGNMRKIKDEYYWDNNLPVLFKLYE